MPQSEDTVTVANPTPPTNIACVSPGSAPSAPGLPFASAGAAGSLTAVAAPTSGVPLPEATGTIVVDTDPGSVSITDMGNFTATPNGSHASAGPPATLPTITGLLPVAPVGNGGTASLTVNGTGFKPWSVVSLAGVPQPTQYNSATQLVVLNAPKRSSAGNTAVTVVTGGTATAPTNWVFS